MISKDIDVILSWNGIFCVFREIVTVGQWIIDRDDKNQKGDVGGQSLDRNQTK